MNTVVKGNISHSIRLASFGTMLFIFLFTARMSAQLSGTKYIPGDYANIKCAVKDLNARGVAAGGVTFNVLAGFADTLWSLDSTTINISINRPGILNPVIFQKYGFGNNPLIQTCAAGCGTNAGNSTGGFGDAIIRIIGEDYITIDGFDLVDVYSGTNQTLSIEYGILLLRKNTSDGCKSIHIKNCGITLNQVNRYGQGIGIINYNSNGSSTNPRDYGGRHENIFIDGNSIQKVNTGIVCMGYNHTVSPYYLYDNNIQIGSESGNTISSLNGNSTAYGIYVSYADSVRINGCGISSTTGTVCGIYLGTGLNSSADVTSNTISLTDTAVASNDMNCIYSSFGNSGTDNHINISGNTVQNTTFTTSSSGKFYGISNNGFPNSLSIDNNTLSVISYMTSATGGFYGLYSSSGTVAGSISISGNIIRDVTNNSTSAGSTYIIYNITAAGGTAVLCDNTVSGVTTLNASYNYTLAQNASASAFKINGNNISSISKAGASGTGTVYGIYINSPITPAINSINVNGNSVRNITSSSASQIFGIFNISDALLKSTCGDTVSFLSSNTGNYVYGIYYYNGSENQMHHNSIHDIYAGGSTAFACGLSVPSYVQNMYTYNNYIYSINAPNSSLAPSSTGMNIDGGSYHYIYYNTVFLNATGNTNGYSTASLYIDINPNIELTDNIVINKSLPGISGRSVAHWRKSADLGSLLSNSNNNNYYAGEPSPRNLIFYDGTNSDQTIAAYKTRALPKRESFSFSENTAFINSSSAPYNLHINPSVQTMCESGGKRVLNPVQVSNDWDCDLRQGESGYPGTGTAPDVGADEGEFTPTLQMGYVSSTTSQTYGYVFTGNSNQCIMRIEILTTGISNSLYVTGFTVNANGTTDINDINKSAAKIFYTAGSGIFDTSLAFGSAEPSVTDFTITGLQNLIEGTNYFWLAYSITSSASDGNIADGECKSINISGSVRTPVVTAPPEYKTIAGIMSGNYYVGQGQTMPNFTTITEAFHNAENRGISGPVNFILTNPVSVPYNSANGEIMPITINQIPGSSATNTITLKPNTGNQALITDNTNGSVIKFCGSDYIIIDGASSGSETRDLTISNLSASNNTCAVWFASLGTGQGSCYNIIKNCNISCGSGSSLNYGIFAGSNLIGMAGADNDHLTIYNNYFCKCQNGIYIFGNAQTSDYCTVSRNLVGPPEGSVNDYIGYTGIYLSYCTNSAVTGNTVRNIINDIPLKKGIYIGTGTISTIVNANSVHGIRYTGTDGNGAAGIYINTGTTASNDSLINNEIYDIKADGYSGNSSYEPYGIAIEGNTGRLAVFYNSVNLFGDISNSGSGYTAAPASLFINTTSNNIDVRNNVFINSMTKTSSPSSQFYTVYSLSPSSAFVNINFNDYYPEGTESILGYLGSNRYTMTNWRTATGKDANSFSLKPRINSNTDLRPQPDSPLLSAAAPIQNITYDILQTVRSLTAPTIGAYEQPIDVAGPEIIIAPLGDTNSTSNRTTYGFALITDPGGVNGAAGTSPRIYFKKNWHNNAFIDNTNSSNGWKWVEGFYNDTCWNFTLDYSILYGGTASAGDVIQYFVIAQDLISPPNASIQKGTPASQPAGVNLLPSNFPVTGDVYSYSITASAPLAGDYLVGLSMFNLVTGKNIKPKNNTETREDNGKNTDFNKKGTERTTNAVTSRTVSHTTKKRNVSIFLFEENGNDYAGSLYAPLNKELKSKFNLPDRMTGVYANITSAVNDLNNSGISGSVRFLLLDASYGYSGTPETFPIKIMQTAGAGSSSTVTIQPQAGISSEIEGDDNHAIFDLNGADFIIIDGRMNGNTSGRNLTIRNANSTFDSSSVIRFINDSRRNTLQYCNIEGNETNDAAGGLILFGTTYLQNGNDSNLIQYNDIRNRSDSAGSYRYGIYSYGSNTSSAANNSDNFIIGNNIYNFWKNDAMSAGINLYYGTGSNWLISGNSFYQTSPRTFNTVSAAGWNVICLGYQSVSNISITGNYIGGSAENCGGTPWNADFSAAGNYSRFYGITGIAGTDAASGINGNIIRNIGLNFDVSSCGYSYVIFAPIMIDLSGLINIGTSSGNIIGSNSGNGSITVNLKGTSTYIPVISGIEHRAYGDVCNNIIAGFTFTVSGSLSNGYEFNGIGRNSVTSGSQIISGNTIGSLTEAGSINHSGTNSAMKFNGIKSEANSQTILISANTISNIVCGAASGICSMRGIIHSGTSAATITGNCISNLSTYSGNENPLSSVNISLSGITLNSPASGCEISRNIVKSLSNELTASNNTWAAGIILNNVAATGLISRNRVYDIKNNSYGTAPGITGIDNYSGNWSVQNNQITLTNEEPASGLNKTSNPRKKGAEKKLLPNPVQIYGIYDNSAAQSSYYYNSVFTGGTASSGNLSSYCIFRNGGSGIILKNNLLYNARTNTLTATGSNYALGSVSTSPLTGNCNSYVVSDTARSIRFGGSGISFAQWKTSTSNDRWSYCAPSEIISWSRLFASVPDGNLNINRTNADAWIVSGKGSPLSDCISDFDSSSIRSGITGEGVTDIGSDEFNETPPDCPLLTETSVPAPGTSTSYVLFGRTVCTIYWDTAGTSYPSGMNIKYFSGINPPNSYGNFAKFYLDAEPSGSISGTTYDFTIYFSQFETYTIVNPMTDTRLCKYSSGSWISFNMTGMGNLQTEFNWVSSFARVRGLNSFSYFTLTDVNVPLPVRLESFNSAVKGRDVILKWITNSESGNAGFEIQRKNANDNGVWERTGYLNSAGGGRNKYEFTDTKLNAGRYSYRLKQNDVSGGCSYFDLPSIVEILLPSEYALSQNYPNPFNPSTKIDFSIPSDGIVNITVYDILGREIKCMLNGYSKAGYYTVIFDGSSLSSGTYFYRLIAKKSGTDFVITKKMSIIK